MYILTCVRFECIYITREMMSTCWHSRLFDGTGWNDQKPPKLRSKIASNESVIHPFGWCMIWALRCTEMHLSIFASQAVHENISKIIHWKHVLSHTLNTPYYTHKNKTLWKIFGLFRKISFKNHSTTNGFKPFFTVQNLEAPRHWISKAIAGSKTALYFGSKQYLRSKSADLLWLDEG